MANYTNPSTAISDEYSHRPKLEQDICQFIAEQPANDAGIHVAAIAQAVGGGGDAHRIRYVARLFFR
jgi:replication factor A2